MFNTFNNPNIIISLREEFNYRIRSTNIAFLYQNNLDQ